MHVARAMSKGPRHGRERRGALVRDFFRACDAPVGRCAGAGIVVAQAGGRDNLCVGRAARPYFVGISIARSTGTAVTLFCGEPSMTRSEYVM